MQLLRRLPFPTLTIGACSVKLHQAFGPLSFPRTTIDFRVGVRAMGFPPLEVVRNLLTLSIRFLDFASTTSED